MKIKLAILEKDINQLNRFTNGFSTKYADKMEIYSFTDKEVALKALTESRINVFIASDVFEIDVSSLPKKCSFAYFVESSDIKSVNEERTICKYQKIDLLYKQILNLYVEKENKEIIFTNGDGTTKVITFTSPCGGVGCSTVAAACALHFASQGKKVFYLNVEHFGSANKFFEAEGQFDMSDIIYAIKSKKNNLALKLESCVKIDPRGVHFYSETKNAMDMLELKNEECIQMISELKNLGIYEYIILDVDFMVGKEMTDLYHHCNRVIWIGDGSEISNGKLARAYQVVSTIEASLDEQLTSMMCLIYNKFSNKTSTVVEGIEIRNIGGVPRFEHATTQQVLRHLAGLDMYEKIFE